MLWGYFYRFNNWTFPFHVKYVAHILRKEANSIESYSIFSFLFQPLPPTQQQVTWFWFSAHLLSITNLVVPPLECNQSQHSKLNTCESTYQHTDHSPFDIISRALMLGKHAQWPLSDFLYKNFPVRKVHVTCILNFLWLKWLQIIYVAKSCKLSIKKGCS